MTLTTTRADQDFEPGYWAAAFAMFNPHATIAFELANDGGALRGTYKRAASEDWRKYKPTDLTSAQWYSPDALKRLVFSHIRHAESCGGRDLPLGEFIRQFKGLSSPSKAKAVRAEMDGIDHLSDFVGAPERVGELLAAMRERSKAPNHRVFGRVGPKRFEAIFERTYDVKEFAYESAKDYTAVGLPYVFEIAVAVTAAPGHLYYGINHTAAFDDPLEGTLLAGPKFKSRGIRGFLQHGHALPEASGYYEFRAPANVAVAVHIITPAPVFLDRGKTRIQLSEDEEDSRG